MRKRLIAAIISLAILIGIIISVFSFGDEEKVYKEGVLVDITGLRDNSMMEKGTLL